MKRGEKTMTAVRQKCAHVAALVVFLASKRRRASCEALRSGGDDVDSRRRQRAIENRDTSKNDSASTARRARANERVQFASVPMRSSLAAVRRRATTKRNSSSSSDDDGGRRRSDYDSDDDDDDKRCSALTVLKPALR